MIKVSKGILSSIKTIRDGINQANEGDIIEVGAGFYEEDVLINKNITIRGTSEKGDVHIQGRVVIHFEHENLANLSHLYFRNEADVYIEKGSLHISDCSFIGGKQEPIKMNKGTNLIVENTIFKENDKPLVLQGNVQFKVCEFTEHLGLEQVVVMEGSKVYFTNCHLSKGKNAMTVEQNCHLTINSCSISHFSENGLYVHANSKCDISNTNLFHIKGRPIQVAKATLHMKRCLLEKNDDMQIFLKEKSKATLEGLTIRHGKGNGVMVDDSTVSIKNSEMTKHDKPQLFIRNGGDLTINKCQLFDVEGNHLRAIKQSKLTIINSHFFASGYPCLSIENSEAKLVGCNIYKSKSDAIFIKDKSKVHISRSYISRNEKSSVYVKENAQVNIHESRIFDSSNGIILRKSTLDIDSSSIYNHEKVHIIIDEQSKAKVNDTKIYRGKANAIFVKDSELSVTKSSMEESELPQVYICGQSEATIEDTRINNGESNGITIHDQSSVKMVQSVISNHKGQKSPAVFVREGASLEMIATTIRNNASEACYFLTDKDVLLSQCLIAGNGDTAQVYLNGSGNFHITESVIADSDVIGIDIHDADPTIEYCIVKDNKQKNIAQTENSRPSIKHSITGDKVFVTGDEGKNNEEKIPTEDVEDLSFETLMEELHAYIGLSNVKSYIQNLTNMLQVSKFRQKQNMITNKVDVPHLVFTGNPGTGKTTVGRLIGKIFKSIGLLESGHLIEVSREDLVGSYIGHSEEKTKEKIEEAMGGVLFIDEAYALAGTDDGDRDFGKKVIDVLVPALENNRGKFVVIVAGYTNEMEVFMKSNPGLADRFTQKIEFHDYNPDELMQIAHKMIQESGYFITEEAEKELLQLITNEYRVRDEAFGNARRVRKIHGDMILAHAERIASIPEKEWTDKLVATFELVDVLKAFKKDKQKYYEVPVNEALLAEKLTELDRLIGLTELKQKIHELVELNRYYRNEGRDKSSLINHMILVGNPGTGKTEVARIIAGIYEALGLLERGQLIEVDRNGLVAQYQGATEKQTTNQIERAMGSTLFIDEAYTLTNRGGNDPGQIAVETLLKKMSDHQGKFMVLAAGYRNEMQAFKESNPGLTRRFSATLEFPDYTPEELMDITALHLGEYVLDSLATAQLTLHYHALYENRDEHFGNAGLASTIARESIKKLDYRMAQLSPEAVTEEMKRTITKDDLALLGK